MRKRNRNLQKSVRARMAKTGESYSTARAHLLGRTGHRRAEKPAPTLTAKVDTSSWPASLDEFASTLDPFADLRESLDGVARALDPFADLRASLAGVSPSPTFDVKALEIAPMFDVRALEIAPIFDVRALEIAPIFDVRALEIAPTALGGLEGLDSIESSLTRIARDAAELLAK